MSPQYFYRDKKKSKQFYFIAEFYPVYLPALCHSLSPEKALPVQQLWCFSKASKIKLHEAV